MSRPGAPAPEPSHPPPSAALACSVLVLNRLYMAVHIVNVRRAFGLLCRELAEVIHPEDGKFATYTFDSWRETSELRAEEKQADDDWIRSVNFEIQVPRVIRLLRFDRLPKQKLHLNRRNVLARDGHTCQYCGRHFPTHLLSIDHVVPRSRGGQTTWENMVCALPGLQPQEGRPHPARSPHEAGRQPHPAEAKPAAVAETEQSKVRKLAGLAE